MKVTHKPDTAHTQLDRNVHSSTVCGLDVQKFHVVKTKTKKTNKNILTPPKTTTKQQQQKTNIKPI